MVLGHNISEGNRTQDIQIKEDITFESCLLNKKTLSGLKKSGFYKPSPIQLHGIPLGKCGFDLLLEAKSGTGKTGVFTVIALEKIDLANGLQVIVLAPTREIAAQICDVMKQIGSGYSGLNVEVVMGGLPIHEDILKFKSKEVHIVVGSPGRLKHLIQDKHIDVSAVRLLILDECDKLVEKSFLTDINYVFSVLPKQKQVIMSSATYPEKYKSFISKFVHNAQHICPDSNSVLLGISQNVTLVKQNSNIVKQTQNRFQELLKIFMAREFKQCLIFCNYQARVAELHRLLTKAKWPATLLYGQQEQLDRLDALKTLQEYKCRILISTDLAARGIDASNVDLVINFEPPFDWQTYLHRIGRAGRYGSYGTAITILSEGQEATKFKEIFQTINLSLNLRNLWTGDQFNCSSSDSSQPSVAAKTDIVQTEKDIPLCVINEELWDILTYDSENNTELFHTFEELQKSFETPSLSSTNDIQSFSDLVTCFQQSNNVAKDDVSYSHLNIRKININKNLLGIQNEENGMKRNGPDHVSCTIRKTNGCENTEKGKQHQHDMQNNLSFEEINDNQHLSQVKTDKIDIKQIQNISVKNIEHSSCFNSSVNYNDIQDYSKALLEAGLPAAFGKNKSTCSSNCMDTRINKKGNYKKEEKLIADNVGLKDEINISSKWQQKPKRFEEIKSAVENTQSLSKTKQSLKYHQDKDIRTVIINCNTVRKNNYNNWYYQLKSNMRQIEYAVYIDEMSRIN